MNIQPQGRLLKQLLPQYLRAINCRHFATSRTSFAACCPLHSDQSPSFSANLKGEVWLWKCHACDVGGTVIDLHARLNNLDPKSQYSAICGGIAEVLRMETACSIHSSVVDFDTEEQSVNTALSPESLETITLPWRKTLYEDVALRDSFAKRLHLPSNLLLQISMRSLYGTMGIVPGGFSWISKRGKRCELREPRLAYIGLGYYKIRAPFGDDGELRFMMFGHQTLPWLSELLIRDKTTVKNVHIHESESSALALIASGFWTPDDSSIVIATSGAGGFNTNWCPLFVGRTVQFWPDADKAGLKFINKTAMVLHGVARKILIRDWNTIVNHR